MTKVYYIMIKTMSLHTILIKYNNRILINDN